MNDNMNLRKDCCIGCRCDGKFCVYRFELPNNVGEKFIKNGMLYTKSCNYFEWD